MKVKVGPITAQYKGAAVFVEKNDADFKAVLNGKGRDTRGAGNAEALITAKLEPISDTTTRVNVRAGPDTGTKAVAVIPPGQTLQVFDVVGDEGSQDGAVTAEPAPPSDEPRKVDMPEPEAVDLLDAAGTPIMKRLAPIIMVIVVVLILRRVLRKKTS